MKVKRRKGIAGWETNQRHIIDNVHLHNNDGSSDQHHGLLDGSVDLKSCVQRLKGLDYKGSISIEIGAEVQDLDGEIERLMGWCD